MTNEIVSTGSLGIVVIGRNEGDRLRTCLSALPQDVCVVYVDSDSTDDSVNWAISRGAEVVKLDISRGFTAGRARNRGWRRLMELDPALKYVQFLDGDCEVLPGWLQTSTDYMELHLDAAAVCGRLKERFPDASVYNALCDLEWDAPSGPIRATGGNALYRLRALVDVKGFRDTLIAGEEPELGLRLSAQGWTLCRIDADMALHDAAMSHFKQWWRRCIRAGYAFAEGNYLHGGSPNYHYDLEVRRLLVWGFGFPATALAVSASVGFFWGACVLLAFPIQVLRLWTRIRKDSRMNSKPPSLAAWRALFLVLGRFPEFQGWMKFHRGRLARRRSKIIEYK